MVQTYHKGNSPFSLVMQTDGNLVLFDANRDVKEASGTYK
jgi:hypothetical protein